jgi:hypothetical protein
MTLEETDRIAPIENFDPIAAFLRKKLKLTPLRFGLLILVCNIALDLFIGARYRVFTSASATPGLLQDLTALLADLLVYEAIGVIYLWTTEGATTLFNTLNEAKLFKSPHVVSDTIERVRGIYASPGAFVAALTIAILNTFSQVGAYMQWLPWKTVGGYIELAPAISFLRAPFWFLGLYGLVFAVFNIFTTIAVLRRLFRNKELHLSPLNPDKCGGLSSINAYTQKLAYGVAVIGLIVSVAMIYEINNGNLLNAYPILLAVGLYIVLAPLIFFLPLGTAHDAMRKAKDEELMIIANEFDQAHEKLKRSAVVWDKDSYTAELDRIELIRKWYGIVEEFPVWPFDMRSLQRFLGIISAPLVPALLSLGINVLQELFMG